jgi:hypothetical protein
VIELKLRNYEKYENDEFNTLRFAIIVESKSNAKGVYLSGLTGNLTKVTYNKTFAVEMLASYGNNSCKNNFDYRGACC